MRDATARQYQDVSGNPVSLDWLVRNEPEWAANQIRHRDTLEREIAELKQWKESACVVMSETRYQEIAVELGLKLGTDIAPRILPAIKEMRERYIREGKEQAAEICATQEKGIYVGGNAMREGIKRGLSLACIMILESITSPTPVMESRPQKTSPDPERRA